MPTPYLHRSGKWAVHYSPKLSPSGKDETVYFATQEDAENDLAARIGERKEHGRSLVTAQERQWIHFLRTQLDDLDQLPEIIQHWRNTRATVQATTAEAVEA